MSKPSAKITRWAKQVYIIQNKPFSVPHKPFSILYSPLSDKITPLCQMNLS